MKILMRCLQEDTDFIESVKSDLGEVASIETCKVLGYTGYDAVMLILTAANAIGALLVPFIIMHMTNNKDDETKSKRRVAIEVEGKELLTLNFEGCSEETVKKLSRRQWIRQWIVNNVFGFVCE